MTVMEKHMRKTKRKKIEWDKKRASCKQRKQLYRPTSIVVDSIGKKN